MRLSLCLVAFFSLCILNSCGGGLDKQLLLGTWKGVELIENMEVSSINVSDVRFEFKDNGKYSYTGNLNNGEAGSYYTLGMALYTTDTTAAQPTEKAVKVIRLSPDSLFFQMNDRGSPQLLKLAR